ncbi:hypothetical protein ACN6LC_007045 [Streptomyces violaceoruber]|uniref:hypothetical protein n=1 Tax=Streptomyces violaceoruber group TaxID=2867121 RepID=UPI00364C7AEA
MGIVPISEWIKRAHKKLLVGWMITVVIVTVGLVVADVMSAEQGSFALTASAVVPAINRYADSRPKADSGHD